MGIRRALLSPPATGTVPLQLSPAQQHARDMATPSITLPARCPMSLWLRLGSWESWLLSIP